MSRVVASLLYALLMTAPAIAEERPDEYLVFVGKRIGFDSVPHPCGEGWIKEEETEKGRIAHVCIPFDALFDARYEIVEILQGSYDSREIKFRVADHYGMPFFAEFDHALLFVNIGPDQPYLEKYQVFAVHRADEGRWAICLQSDAAPEQQEEVAKPNEVVKNLEIISDRPLQEVREWFGEDEIQLIDGRLTCKTGIYVEDLYEEVRQGVLVNRGVALPPLQQVKPVR